jgi:hypothetical protein
MQNLPDVKSLYEILPKGVEGGKEFARIIDLLLFHEARRGGEKISLIDDAAGDYCGLDSFEGDRFRKEGTTGYQYKFYPSPLSSEHRHNIIGALKKVAESQKTLKLKKWILVTPQDLIESGAKKGGGDVTWFENLRKELNLNFVIEHCGHKKILSLFLQTKYMALFYYPQLVPDKSYQRRTIEDTRKRYDDGLIKLLRDIQFVGMSVYKQEASKGIPIENIYIPILVEPESGRTDKISTGINPLQLIKAGNKAVILGDPGSGKSTMIKFLSLSGISKRSIQVANAPPWAAAKTSAGVW